MLALQCQKAGRTLLVMSQLDHVSRRVLAGQSACCWRMANSPQAGHTMVRNRSMVARHQ
jgi:hypothetical protein